MSTDRETASIVRSWLEDGVTRLPDRVLDTVLDQLPATPQRRPRWAAWRPNSMSFYTKVAVAAAAVLVVALAGYQLLPRNGSVGGPTTGPSPTPTLLAQGTFVVKGFNTTLDATGAGSSVSGTMRVVPPGGGVMAVDLQCERTIDGLLWIGGDITEQTADMSAQKGTRAAIVFDPVAPVKAVFAFQFNDPRSATCLAFFDDILALGPLDSSLEPIQGTVTLNPSAATATAGAARTITDGPLDAGKYVLDPTLGITLDVPAGWEGCCAGVVTKGDFAGLYTQNLTTAIVYEEPCTWASGRQSQPRGASAIAAALAAQHRRNGTAPEDVTVGGVRAVHVRLTVPADQKVSPTDGQDFVNCDEGQFRSWTTTQGDVRYHQGPGQIDDVYLVDVNASTFAFDVISGPGIAAQDAADLAGMLASIRFHPPE